MTNKEAIEYCIKLAKNGKENDIRPNPFVGAVVLDANNEVIGTGYHKKIGEPHAEVYAIEEALQKTENLSQCTLYLSLEPCSHFGKTPPCCDFIIQHKLKKVVIASLDPNPKVSSIEKLRENGIEVELRINPLAEMLNKRFFIQHKLKRPYFLIKSATTIDGKIADRFHESKWITNELARNYVHENLRVSVDAILTSYKTIIQDHSSLTIRIKDQAPKETNVIIIDKDLELLKASNRQLPIFYPRKDTKIFFLTAAISPESKNDSFVFIQARFNEDGIIYNSVDEALLKFGLYKILTEAGSKVNSSLIEQGHADEYLWFIAPKILNDLSGLTMLGLDQVKALKDSSLLTLKEIKSFENDILLHYEFANTI